MKQLEDESATFRLNLARSQGARFVNRVYYAGNLISDEKSMVVEMTAQLLRRERSETCRPSAISDKSLMYGEV